MLKIYVGLLNVINLRLFDGEGEGETGSGTETLDPIAGSSQSQSEPEVVYGKATEEEPLTEGSPDTQGNENIVSFDFSKLTTPEAKAEAYKQIKDSFKDEFSEEFQQVFNKRFKGHKEIEAKVNQYEPVIDSLLKYHNVDTVEQLQEVLENEVLAELADREGFSSVEKYRDHYSTKKENERLRSQVQTREEEESQQKRIDDWVKQGLAMQKDIPDFDLAKEFENPKFAEMVDKKGYSVEDAYFIIHKHEILKNNASTVAKTVEQSVLSNIKAKGQRITENGLRQSPGVIRKSDPSKFTDKDIEAIEERVRRGEKISF